MVPSFQIPGNSDRAPVPTLRFAPSPNGHLHLGHVRSALIGHGLAKTSGGRFLVRLEDIDVARCRSDFAASILDDLQWLGLDWETPVRQQSQHFQDYRAAADRLLAAGLLYPCYASRSEILAAANQHQCDPDGVPLYPGARRCISPAEAERRRKRGEPFALRLDMPKALAKARELNGGHPLTFTEMDAEQGNFGLARTIEAHAEHWGDAVLVRKDTPTSYHLSVVVDDALQGVTHVTRGRDLYAATGLHRLLQVHLGLSEPVYHHHMLIVGPDGRKLSKSAGAPSLKSLRAKGLSPDDARRLCLEH